MCTKIASCMLACLNDYARYQLFNHIRQNPLLITEKPEMYSWSTDTDHDPDCQVGRLQLDRPHLHQQQYVYISVKDVSVYSTLNFTRESNPVSGPWSSEHSQSKDFTALWLLWKISLQNR